MKSLEQEMLYAIATHLLQTTSEINSWGEFTESTLYKICKLYVELEWNDKKDSAYISDKVMHSLTQKKEKKK